MAATAAFKYGSKAARIRKIRKLRRNEINFRRTQVALDKEVKSFPAFLRKTGKKEIGLLDEAKLFRRAFKRTPASAGRKVPQYFYNRVKQGSRLTGRLSRTNNLPLHRQARIHSNLASRTGYETVREFSELVVPKIVIGSGIAGTTVLGAKAINKKYQARKKRAGEISNDR